MKKLNHDEILEISSPYLNKGRKDDIWKITEIQVDGTKSYSKVMMDKYYVSATDVGFHLTSFSTLEFLSQIFIAHHHILNNLPKKMQEAWMMESSIKCNKAIRDPLNINVTAEINYTKKVGSKFLGVMNAEVRDKTGLFTAEIKALIA